MSRYAPSEEIQWAQVVSVVPEAAAEFEAAMRRHNLTEDKVIPLLDGMEVQDDEYEPLDLPDEIDQAFDRLCDRFQAATGLQLGFNWEEHEWMDLDHNMHDYVVGWEVKGAWQLTDAGKRFFGEDSDG